MLLLDGSYREALGSLPREERAQNQPNRPLDWFHQFTAFLLLSRLFENSDVQFIKKKFGRASPCWCMIQFGVNNSNGRYCVAHVNTFLGAYSKVKTKLLVDLIFMDSNL